MRWMLTIAAATALIGCPVWAEAPRLPSSAPIPPAELEAYVDAVVSGAMRRDHVAGAVVSVVQDGQVVLAKGYGFADVDRGRPADPQRTLFRIGSITKTFTWILALEEVDQGRLSLDAPINTYLPAKARLPDEGFRGQVRLRDLITHSAGFEERLLRDLFFHDPARLRPLDDYLAARRPRRVWEPGAVTAYSNYGAALAGAAVAHVEGRPWQDVLEQKILQPAGMTLTTGRAPYPPRADLPAPMPADLARDRSLNYRWTGARHLARPYEYVGFAPQGDIASTASDMARYMNLLLAGGVLDGHTVFSPRTAAALRTPMRDYGGGMSANGGIFQVVAPGGFSAYRHSGASIDTNANMTLVPVLRLGVFVATNTESGAGLTGDLATGLIRRFYAAPKPPPAPDPALLQRADAYAGEFISTRRAFHGLEAFALGFRATPVTVAEPGYLRVGDARFVPAGPPGRFRNVDQPEVQLRAVMRDGRLVRLLWGSEEFERRPVLRRTRTIGYAALATAFAAVAVLTGLFSPARWRAAQSPAQRWAGRLRGAAAALWIIAMGAFVSKLSQGLDDPASVAFDWPGPLIVLASSAALGAAIITFMTAVLTPAALRGRGGWTPLRKVRFVTTVTAFVLLAAPLAYLGALTPWNP